MIAKVLDTLGAAVLGRLDPASSAVARAMWEELSHLGRARALARLDRVAIAAAVSIDGFNWEWTGVDPDEQALRLAFARLVLALAPTAEVGGLALMRRTLGELEAQARDGHEPCAHPALAAEVALALGTLFEREATHGGGLAAARLAIAHVELGACDLAADFLAAEVLEDEPGLVLALETEAARPELDACERDAALALAGELARRGEPSAYTAFLARNLDRHPRLLDRLVERAREAEDWERVLELARRGLTLREDRARYNALAALALERLGRALP